MKVKAKKSLVMAFSNLQVITENLSYEFEKINGGIILVNDIGINHEFLFEDTLLNFSDTFDFL